MEYDIKEAVLKNDIINKKFNGDMSQVKIVKRKEKTIYVQKADIKYILKQEEIAYKATPNIQQVDYYEKLDEHWNDLMSVEYQDFAVDFPKANTTKFIYCPKCHNGTVNSTTCTTCSGNAKVYQYCQITLAGTKFTRKFEFDDKKSNLKIKDKFKKELRRNFDDFIPISKHQLFNENEKIYKEMKQEIEHLNDNTANYENIFYGKCVKHEVVESIYKMHITSYKATYGRKNLKFYVYGKDNKIFVYS